MEETIVFHRCKDFINQFVYAFHCKGQDYLLVVQKNKENLYYPYAIFHQGKVNCALCNEKDSLRCPGLEKQKLKIFKLFLESPEHRLHWVHVPHVLNTKRKETSHVT